MAIRRMQGVDITTVASGIIGEYGHDWEVKRFYVWRNEETFYELYVHGERWTQHKSIAEALAVLVDQFSE